MIETFIADLSRRLPLQSAEESYIRQQLPIRNYARGEMLLQEGQVSNAFFYNLQGLVRIFYPKDFEEKTAYFYEEHTFISAYESFVHQVPSRASFQALEETQVVVISTEKAREMLQQFPRFEALARIMMEEELIIYQDIIASFVSRSPEERYIHLLSTQPRIFQRVAQHHIASFIGVKPESLSRIKRRAQERRS